VYLCCLFSSFLNCVNFFPFFALCFSAFVYLFIVMSCLLTFLLCTSCTILILIILITKTHYVLIVVPSATDSVSRIELRPAFGTLLTAPPLHTICHCNKKQTLVNILVTNLAADSHYSHRFSNKSTDIMLHSISLVITSGELELGSCNSSSLLHDWRWQQLAINRPFFQYFNRIRQ